MIGDSLSFIMTTVTTDGICHQPSASFDSMIEVLQCGRNELFKFTNFLRIVGRTEGGFIFTPTFLYCLPWGWNIIFVIHVHGQRNLCIGPVDCDGTLSGRIGNNYVIVVTTLLYLPRSKLHEQNICKWYFNLCFVLHFKRGQTTT